MIVGVSSVLNEASIIRQCSTHLLANGVDKLIISDGGSTDATPDILTSLDGVQFEWQDGSFDQGAEISRLTHLALARGATWVIPFDADEFWIDPLGDSISSILNAQPPDIGLIHCAAFTHLSWDLKVAQQKHFGKVAFRPTSDICVEWGNHAVYGTTGSAMHGLLEIRELQYRDWDHLQAKITKAKDLFASWDVPWVYGGHMRALAAMDSTQLEEFWSGLQGLETIHDPIPYRGT